MAGFSNARQVLLVAVLFVFLVMNAQGRALVDKRNDGRHLLHQLGNGDGAKPSSVEWASTMDADPTRTAPGGPDPQHYIHGPSPVP
ncbi:hypothetical protein ACJRO7_006892 [Eucalyptus globulus]|uniref:Uncharacterized protein n=1 Tax=Eucalyptus globulus TaxID=34317 RepID=A0ABD3IN57_EUCGL